MPSHRHLVLLLLAASLCVGCSSTPSTEATPTFEPVVRLAPDPLVTPEAVVQVYGARVARWHGYFGVHTWIAVKRTGADHFVVHEVTRNQLLRTGSCVISHVRQVDALWSGNPPHLIKDVRGAGVDALIDRIEVAVRNYPYADRYRIWPGPNSNTFVAHVLKEVPELRVDLPSTAVGKDYLGANPFGRTLSGTGGQVSFFGLLGVSAGLEEGVELNLFGLIFGVDPNSLALKLPVLGRVGPSQGAIVTIEPVEPAAVAHTAAMAP